MHFALPTTELPAIPNDKPGAFRTIELEINTACDCACFGCDRFSDVTNAPAMTISQVALFIQESIALGWTWERIRVLGGEPTLHPRLMYIIHMLTAYRDRCLPDCLIQVLSNGLGKADKCAAVLASMRVDLHCETKERGVQPSWFRNTRIVPVDRDPDVGALEPCGIFGVRGCGLGLTRHGFFLDGAGASLAKVNGLDVGVQHLRDVTMDAMLAQARVLCRLCGHWNPSDGTEVTKQVSETGMVTGQFLTLALKRYEIDPPKMTLYGE